MVHYYKESTEAGTPELLFTALDKKAKTFVHIQIIPGSRKPKGKKTVSGKYIQNNIAKSSVDPLGALVTDKLLPLYYAGTVENPTFTVLHYKGYAKKITEKEFTLATQSLREIHT